MNQDYHISIKSFNELSIAELYSILQLRAMVFVVEQNCPYLDPDGNDQHAEHLMVTKGNDLVAYSRIFHPGVLKPAAVIGRVITHPGERGKGTGKLLMQESVRYILEKYPQAEIYLGAQEYLRNFYGGFGFEQCGEGYLEDGIPHIPMIRKHQQ